MAFTGQLSDADRACMHEREEAVEQDKFPIYRLMFSYQYPTGVRVLFERYDHGNPRGWVCIQSALGADERVAIKALRDLRHAFTAELKRSRAEQAERDEATRMRLRAAGHTPSHGVYGTSLTYKLFGG